MTGSRDSLAALDAFFAASPAVARAARPLARAARVGLDLDEGPAGFTVAGGRPQVTAGAPADPDFTLRLPAAAVERLCADPAAGVGELGVALFSLVVEREPSRHVRVSVHAPTSRLVAHGWLAVLALGGLPVALWLLRRGLADPRAVIERLRRPRAGPSAGPGR